jgi:DNA ligase-1
VKTHDDAEARVIAHLPGKGRLAGQTGALLVETPDGLRFRLGTGLRDADHQNPPGIGRWITYRYRGKNASGVPRFASFLRVRDDFRP